MEDFGDILKILVMFVTLVTAANGFIRKMLGSAKASARPQPPVATTQEQWENDEEVWDEEAEIIETVSSRIQFTELPPLSARQQPVAALTSSVPTPPVQHTLPKKNKPGIDLRSHKEAKKAFLYSEVFGRKYT